VGPRTSGDVIATQCGWKRKGADDEDQAGAEVIESMNAIVATKRRKGYATTSGNLHEPTSSLSLEMNSALDSIPALSVVGTLEAGDMSAAADGGSARPGITVNTQISDGSWANRSLGEEGTPTIEGCSPRKTGLAALQASQDAVPNFSQCVVAQMGPPARMAAGPTRIRNRFNQDLAENSPWDGINPFGREMYGPLGTLVALPGRGEPSHHNLGSGTSVGHTPVAASAYVDEAWGGRFSQRPSANDAGGSILFDGTGPATPFDLNIAARVMGDYHVDPVSSTWIYLHRGADFDYSDTISGNINHVEDKVQDTTSSDLANNPEYYLHFVESD
jgi:hypothetical protein